LLNILNFSYISRFYGKDILHSKIERAFISNYQKLGYITPESLTILKPIREVSYYSLEHNRLNKKEIKKSDFMDTISYFQIAAEWKKFNKNTAIPAKN